MLNLTETLCNFRLSVVVLHFSNPVYFVISGLKIAGAKILVCNDQGKQYGEVCPNCLGKGFDWLSDRFEQLNQPRQKIARWQPQRLPIPMGA